MKKNKMMRLASMMLVLTLLSTCAISGTFAKYTTTDSASDSARVAKWGVVLQVEGDLYSKNYESSDNDNIATASETGISVKGEQISTSTNVVAPGTKNEEGFKFTVEGKPEVSTKATATIKTQNIFLAAGEYGVMVEYGTMTQETFDSIKGRTDNSADAYANDLYTEANGVYTAATSWSENVKYYTLEDNVTLSDVYYPVQYKLDGQGAKYNGLDNSVAYSVDTLAEVAKKIAVQFGENGNGNTDTSNQVTTWEITTGKTFNPNVDLTDDANGLNLDDSVLTWEWAFDGQDDQADTILGNLMAERVDGATGTDFKAEVVKITSESSTTTIKAPVEYTDFCLDTQFDLSITIDQVD